MTDLYKDYYKHHSYAWENINYKISDRDFEKKLGMVFEKFAKVPRVLEIWSGQWKFTHFCKMKWVTEYIGLEIDETMAQSTAEEFKPFSILNQDAVDFLKNSSEKFDIIFMSHVFEHFSIEDGIDLAKLIRAHLNDNWVWINFMPNGGSLIGNSLRYCDITHKTIYTVTSFNQVLKISWFQAKDISHHTVFPLLSLAPRIMYFCFYHLPFYLFRVLTWSTNVYSLEILTTTHKS